MANNCFVTDAGHQWPAHFVADTGSTIIVTMAGDNGFNAVCNGAPRAGSVTWNNAAHNVRLPGAWDPRTRQVTLRKPNAVLTLFEVSHRFAWSKLASHPGVRLLGAKPAMGLLGADGDAAVPNILDVLNKAKKAPSSTSVLAVPADLGSDASDSDKITDIMLLDSYISVMASALLYKDPEYAKNGPDITTPEGASKFTRKLANCRLRVMTQGLGGVLSLGDSSAQTFTKSTTSADLHLSFLTNFFSDFGFNSASMKQLDQIMTNIVKSLSDLQASWSDTSQSLDHMISVYFLEKVMGSEVKIAKIRLFFLHVDQKSWTLSIGKSSVAHFDFHMNYSDQIATMNHETMKDLRPIIKEYVEAQAKTSLEDVNKLVAMAAVQSDKTA
eukprot:TRINITY_DN8030_c0_g1_i1.p1 TRINITY_DN8030_c0_g1~~TRINITY_DN8030_c0_g1_i1.p1  ORF type:complete len:384 (-),score=97.94 TRINITY_DN8030_c0_g1_i1:392-1543(-)